MVNAGPASSTVLSLSRNFLGKHMVWTSREVQRRMPYAAIPPERQTDVSLQDEQTRSPMCLEVNLPLHIRHFRVFLTWGRSGSGFFVSVRREAIMPPSALQGVQQLAGSEPTLRAPTTLQLPQEVLS